MELAAHWHSCQNLQKTSEYFLQQYTGGEMILSRRESLLLFLSFAYPFGIISPLCFCSLTTGDSRNNSGRETSQILCWGQNTILFVGVEWESGE